TPGVAVTPSANGLLTATEVPDPGYTASAWGGDCAPNGTITLAPGDNKTCTITNDDKPSNPTPTGHVAETGTTCQQFRAGTWGYLDTVLYSVKNGTIGTVNPGVFFYYNKITAPTSGGFSITVGEINNGTW